MARRFQGLSGLAIGRPVLTTMLMLGLVVLGIYSFRRLGVDQYPKVDIPVVTVQTVYSGASPEAIEREITRPLEEAFRPIDGVDRITSTSIEGISQVIVEFDLDREAEASAQDIRARIDGVRRTLPSEIEPPIVQTFNPNDQPVISLALSSDVIPLAELTALADEALRPRLESVPGVGAVRINGGREREVRVELHPDRLQALGVSVQEVIAALERQNLEVPAGRVEDGSRERLVRVTGRIADAAQFGQVRVASRGSQPIRLDDVARVEDGVEEERTAALADGRPAVSLDLVKVSGANTVEVADRVAEAIGELESVVPAGAELDLVRDNAVAIRASVEDVIHELVLGAILTIAVVLLFLNDAKATAITSLALPVSVISSFILMSALGFTLNMLTLMALSLSIGILIDDAIVVIENIVRRRELGDDAHEAADRGTREIMLAVLATTLTIVAVFVPVAFMGGIVGRFFFPFGLTVAWAVLVSLLVSFTLTPMLAAKWGVEPHDGRRGGRLRRAIAGFNAWFDRQAGRYRVVIGWALAHRRATLALAAGALVAAFALLPLIGAGFMPDSDRSEFSVSFETPEGSSLAYSRSKAEQIVATLARLEGVESTYATIGAGPTGTVTRGDIYVKLVPASDRQRSQAEVMVAAREHLSHFYGARIAVLDAGTVGGSQAPLSVELRGREVDQLLRLADAVERELGSIKGVVDVRSSLGRPRPELRIEVDRDVAREVGLDIGQVAATVRPLLAGETATRWEGPTGEERDVVVRIAGERRSSTADVVTLPLATSQRTADGAAVTVPLGAVARIEEGSAPAQIDRKDLERVATISAGTAPDLSVAEASAAIRDRLAGLDIPTGYTARLGGETEQMEETAGYVLEAILLAVILIYLILAAQLESFTQPLAIMVSLPLSLVGVLVALLLTGDTLNMMSMIGVILLMGLVTKNAILLVDHANQRRAEGADVTSALIEAGAVRLRPIAMTTVAMVAGMLPVALALGEGGGFRAPMARAVIGGLITSTLLTVVVIPVAYSYFDGLGSWLRRAASRWRLAGRGGGRGGAVWEQGLGLGDSRMEPAIRVRKK